MFISDMFKQKPLVYSLEVFPPKKDYSFDEISSVLGDMCALKPDYISVTYGAGGSIADNKTLELCDIIKNGNGVEALAHLTCVSTKKEDLDTLLNNLQAKGINNILALRGDINPNLPISKDFKYASDLATYLNNRGGFGISGACYPEGHFESPSLVKDIKNLKKKVQAGVSHLNSQMFFDNEDFYNMLELFELADIDVPVQAGIMPVTRKNQISRIVELSGSKLPKKFTRIIARYENDPESLTKAGIAYAVEQIIDLIAGGVKGIHLYTMNNPYVAAEITRNIAPFLKNEN